MEEVEKHGMEQTKFHVLEALLRLRQAACHPGLLDDSRKGETSAKLDALGLTERTIVVFVSDNGGMSAANFGRPDRVVAANALDGAYATSNLPLRGAKGWLYEGGIRVPLMIRAPGSGVRGGVVSHVPVISTDLYPTLLELAGLPALPEQHQDGVSLAPLLRGGAAPARRGGGRSRSRANDKPARHTAQECVRAGRDRIELCRLCVR
jgi:arylsulfatase A-like enzyme